MPDKTATPEIDRQLASSSMSDRLTLITQISPRAVFTTSLGKEDQVLLWHIAKDAHPITIVTLNTGKLFPETLTLLDATRSRYEIDIKAVEPEANAVDDYVQAHGEDGFYASIEARKRCCFIRKVAPLRQALAGADAWITGLTREQSSGRSSTPFAEWDEAHSLIKFNPLADVTSQEVAATVQAHDIPINSLHARGYPSIGCEPCTRAIKPGEHPRAGRWWWENESSSECGLHVAQNSHATPNTSEPGLLHDRT